MYTLHGEEFSDIDDLNEELAELFWQAFGDSFGDDVPAKRENFNCWTDSLCKDGELCVEGYLECDLIYTACDARARKWI